MRHKNKGYVFILVVSLVAFACTCGVVIYKINNPSAPKVITRAKSTKIEFLEHVIAEFQKKEKRLPYDLNELVAKEYVTPADILDDNGKILFYENGKVDINH
ncbi:hypothetical protein [Candidatus Uabimicrobium amorphum]|uniref:Uncharacterized protein n=1 Tax=Uabimicrobium amorphum TaxID=2596890 RepID=A0A5S9INQ2_UABAM|nr:hypothetical protein [Candidatus Uabimicrobium amorphum]BBM84796.1 hypothetical protein UABAM_03157 [Candidatus Uabimicrobium amorphum]